ncbi:right-handed parallel beta-helix repeat-containing protein [Microbacterium sp. NPDC057659]|uniref:right-handed parallel beta-helix repeat-containing protein n=1 Tax=Microbacterium sp. NPDC057659 TaxID=3346198 RepID=UPI00366EDAC7
MRLKALASSFTLAIMAAFCLTAAPAASAATAVPAPMPAWSTSGARAPQGSAPVGTARYAVPAGAIHVDSSRGSAAGTGSATAPYASVQDAIGKAPSGSTIVLRGGTYNESLTVPTGKRLTIQSYPGEAVWLDGSKPLTQWYSSGTVWYAPGWNYNFDSSPTDTKGAPDGTSAGWQWVNPAKPMAAHPEQVWIDGVPLQEVASLAQVKAGTFFADKAAKRLYIGSTPVGKEVRAAVLTKAMSLRGDGVTVRGIGIRKYATSVWMMGAVTIEAPNATFENVAIYDSATTGIFVGAANAKLTKLTVARNGMLGVSANYADNLRVSGLLVVQNNTEGFNNAPVSGGLKITKSRVFSVTDSAFLRNNGPGIWVDESVYDIDILRNDVVANTGTGVFLELSQRADVIDNVVLNNKGNGVKVNNTGSVQIWNNTIVGGNRTLNIVQDSRRADDPAVPGHDKRRPFPDPTMPWLVSGVTVGNNVIAASSGNCTYCVEDYSVRFTAAQMKISTNGNLVQRTSSTSPAWVYVWSRGSVNVNPAVYTSVKAFIAGTGQEKSAVAVDGRAVTDASGRILPGLLLKPVTPSAAVAALGAKARVGATFK